MKKYTVEYYTTIHSGRDAGYEEKKVRICENSIEVADTLRTFPDAKVYVSEELKAEQIQELKGEGMQKKAELKKIKELEKIEEKIKLLEERKNEILNQ